MPVDEARPGERARVGEPSTRVRLARLAWETALATDGVREASPGPLRQWCTNDRGELLSGVLVAALADGRFDVELSLVVGWPAPPLHELAERVRSGIARAAQAAGLEERLGTLSVSFSDVIEPAELV